MKKRGSEKYYILMSMILGLLVLSISIYFIFNEYFNKDDLDWEACRQSVVLRSIKIEEEGGFDLTAKPINKALDSQFPFKCKNGVITVNYKDKERFLREIANSIASCYYLYGESKYPLYASNWIISQSTHCFICDRIHFTSEVKDYYKDINVGEYLIKTPMKEGKTYFDYVYLSRARELLSNENFIKYEKETREAVLSASIFDASNGDIIVMNRFTSSSYLGRGWSSGISFGQPNLKPQFLNTCYKIETIPA
jgi:hypothetical protein